MLPQRLFSVLREQIGGFLRPGYTGTHDVEALNRELRPYAALDIVRTFYLHTFDNPAFQSFLKSRIAAELGE